MFKLLAKSEAIKNALINAGYRNIVIEERDSLLTHCFFTKKLELPSQMSISNYRLVPINSNYALELIEMHIKKEKVLLMQLPSIEMTNTISQLSIIDYHIEILNNIYLRIYFQGKLIDEIKMHRTNWRDFYLLQEFVVKEVQTKMYFTLSLGYSLIKFIYKNFPFDEFNYKEIIVEYEQVEETFRKYCSVAKIKYLSNLTLEEKEEYLSGSLGQDIKMTPWSFEIFSYKRCLANTIYNMIEIGFILTNPFGELYEPVKIDLSI